MEDAPTPALLAVYLAGGTARDEERLSGRFGDGLTGLGAPTDALQRAGLSPRLAQRLSALSDGRALDAERRALERLGARTVSWRDPAYPRGLLHLDRPPALLTVRGRWPPPDPSLAMVGARAATGYGRSWSERLAAAAVAAGHGVVSGLARGVDRWSLASALDAGGATVAVLGNGLGRAFPAENRRLQERLAVEGTLVSEFPVGHPPDRWTFPRRNRVIAALARAVLVVEAGRRSGALITVDRALELGRDVLVVPGPLGAPASEGTNRLLAQGAQPVLDEAHLTECLLGPSAVDGAPPAALTGDPVLAALADDGTVADDIAAGTGLGIAEVRSRLIALELEGRVVQRPGDRWLRRR